MRPADRHEAQAHAVSAAVGGALAKVAKTHGPLCPAALADGLRRVAQDFDRLAACGRRIE